MKMKFTLLLATALICFSRINAQNTFPSTGSVGIGTTTPDASSLLEIKSTSKGLLIPRITKAQRDAISSPATGLMIYQINAAPGFYYYDGTKWSAVSTSGASRTLGNLIAPTAINADLLPNYDNNINLGSSSLKYGNVYTYNLKFADGSLQTTAFIPYTAGTGISISGNSISSTLTGSQWITAAPNIYYNTGNVGIGTATPTTGGLVVNTKAGAVNAMFGSNTTGVAIESSNPGIGLNTYYNNGRKFIAAGYGAVIGLDPASGLLGFYNSASSGVAGASATTPADLAITATGNVGIGTTTPAAKLDVNGDAQINGLTVGRGSGNVSTNVVTGHYALVSNTTGGYNVAGGWYILANNTTGNYNVATGSFALLNNTTGSSNSAFGTDALYANKSGYSNIAIGPFALYNNTTASNNVAIGDSALYNNGLNASKIYNAVFNTAIGSKALYNNTTGSDNSAIGIMALYYNTTGNDNKADGVRALYSNTTGSYNTADGDEALYSNTTGSDNMATGAGALYDNDSGFANTASGAGALTNNTNGNYNTANGYFAIFNSTGDYNTGIGANAAMSANANDNTTVIGYNAIVDASNKVRVGSTTVTSIGGEVGWTSFSDGRYKKNIKEDVKGLSFINALRPITYTLDLGGINDHYDAIMKNRPDSIKQKIRAEMKESETAGSKIIYNGFVAQEVESSANKLNYNFSGVDKPATKDGLYGLRYSDFVVPLVKAVQELSKLNDAKDSAIQQQNNKIDNMQKQIDELKTMIMPGNQSSSNLSTQINKQTVELSAIATLSQNVPNPFPNSTTINYYLPVNNNNAYINFYELNGMLLKSVKLSGNGKGSINLKVNELPSGVYSYTLFSDGKTIDSKQMIISK